MDEPRLDPRQLRSQKALRAAILKLAAEQPIAQVSMSQVARASGVHRSTVYQHATSPDDLLCQALRAQLDEVGATLFLPDSATQLPATVRRVSLDVLDHLEEHEVIYARELQLGASAVSAMLQDQFADSATKMIAAYQLQPPGLPTSAKPFVRQATVRWIAHGMVGILGSWLTTPAPRDRDTYLQAQAALVPSWWPSPLPG